MLAKPAKPFFIRLSLSKDSVAGVLHPECDLLRLYD